MRFKLLILGTILLILLLLFFCSFSSPSILIYLISNFPFSSIVWISLFSEGGLYIVTIGPFILKFLLISFLDLPVVFFIICASISILNETSEAVFPNEGFSFSFSKFQSASESLFAAEIALFSHNDIFERKKDLKFVVFWALSSPPSELLDLDLDFLSFSSFL